MLNRTLKDISRTLPVRPIIVTITGDGSSTLHLLPEPITNKRLLMNGGIPLPDESYTDSYTSQYFTILGADRGVNFGWAFVDDYRIRVSPALGSGITRELHMYGYLGDVVESANQNSYSGATVTNDSTTVTKSGVTFITDGVVRDQAITIEDADGIPRYYRIHTVDSETQITLTEKYKETTGTRNIDIGNSTGLPEVYNEMLGYGIKWRLLEIEGDPRWKEVRDLYQVEKKKADQELSRLMRGRRIPGRRISSRRHVR